MNNYKLGSLFDGSGGFPLAGTLCGIEPVWAAEVEPYPIAVTRSRFPNMKHLGDISKVNGAEIEPVDIITFGSPCQDLSVAGKRAGLKHEANGDEETTRSGLFMEAVRIIKEMRKATNGKYPTFALWENVPGAFSSNKGEDFRIVCEELIKIIEPSATMPEVPQKGWNYADSYVGDGWSLAYRVLDAQYWGVPQRRRRIYLVTDFRGERAREVLFEREGLRGYFTQGRTPWQTTPSNAQGSSGADDREGEENRDGRGRQLDDVAYGIDHAITTGGNCTAQGPCVYEDVQATLKASGPHSVAYTLKIRSGCEGGGKGVLIQKDKSATLACNNDQCLFQPKGADIYNLATTGDVVGSLTAGGYGSTGTSPKVIIPILDDQGGQSINVRTDGKAPTITAAAGMSGNNQPVICLQGNGIDRADNAGGNQRMPDKENFNCVIENKPNYIVRRLTPTECARLQGFADCHGHLEDKTFLTDVEFKFWTDVRNTHAAINGKKVQDYTRKQMLTWYNKLWTDSAEYKMWGNGIALPTALYVVQGIADALNTEETEIEDWML